jgi:hypothetical protein
MLLYSAIISQLAAKSSLNHAANDRLSACSLADSDH